MRSHNARRNCDRATYSPMSVNAGRAMATVGEDLSWQWRKVFGRHKAEIKSIARASTDRKAGATVSRQCETVHWRWWRRFEGQ